MISLDDARALIAEKLRLLAPARALLAAARGRVLAEDAVATEDAPAFDRSAVDGYALRAGDLAERVRVVAEIQAGEVSLVTIGPGECARIFTGAAVPSGASQVIMQEDVQREGDFIVLTRRSTETHIRRRGEDARAGATLLRAGTQLGSTELALLAQLGVTRPQVSPVVRALHLTTGNELVEADALPGPGQIRDTNSTLIAALLAERGAEVVRHRRCGDSLEALAGAVEDIAPESWDLLLISGGASVGDYDFGARALEQLGFTIHFRQLDLRPGKPLIFATRPCPGGAAHGQVAFVIPGNPVSHFVTFHTAIARAIECLEGAPESWPLVTIPLARAIDDAPCPRETWSPARVSWEAGTLAATPLAWQSSGDLCGLAGASALIRIPARSQPLPSGSAVSCLLLDLAR